MAGKMIVLGVVVLIVILVGYLVHDSLVLRKMKEADLKVMVQEAAEHRGAKLLNGPVISYKCPGDVDYHHVTMTRKKINIGRDASNDIVLMDESVEGKHATIEKKIKGNSVYYEFVNLSRFNLAEYFNQEKNIYEYLAYKQGIVLDDKEGFFIGETKVIVTLPQKSHAPSKTERMIIKREEEKGAVPEFRAVSGDSFTGRAGMRKPYVEAPVRSISPEDTVVVGRPTRPVYDDGLATEATIVYKREPSLRAVFKDEIDI